LAINTSAIFSLRSFGYKKKKEHCLACKAVTNQLTRNA